ncbi:MAG: hypothetical protein RLZZ524_2530 [Pseudomonadota bacterium]
MNQSPSIGALAGALAKAQAEMVAAEYDRENPHFRSKYATLASVWDACRRPLALNGLAVIQASEWLDGRVIVTTTLAHASGEWISTSLSLKPLKDDPQGVGSAITYGRRYTLASVAGVTADDDDDGNAASAAPRKPAERKPTPAPAPKPAAPPPPQPVEPPPLGTAARIGHDLETIKDLCWKLGAKTRPAMLAQLTDVLSRTITGSAELSEEDRAQAINNLRVKLMAQEENK